MSGTGSMKGLKLTSLKADVAREEGGDWVDSLAFPGVAFKVRSLNASGYTLARDSLLLRLRRRFNGQPVPQEVTSAELGALYCERILLGWNGLDEPYSPERALEVLCDPAYRAVLKDVEDCAARLGALNLEYVATDLKN